MQPLRNAIELEILVNVEQVHAPEELSTALELIGENTFSRLSRVLIDAEVVWSAFGMGESGVFFIETRSAFAVLSRDSRPYTDAGFNIFELLTSNPAEIVNLGFLIYEDYRRFMELLLPAQGCLNLESLAIKSSEFGRSEFGKLFVHMSKLAPRLATLVISTDAASYDGSDWSVFRKLPRSVKNLYLEFDSCDYRQRRFVGSDDSDDGVIGSDDSDYDDSDNYAIGEEVLDLICEHISSDVLCHVLRPDGGSSICAYYLTLIKGLTESNGKLWTHPAFVSGRGRVR
jgi:hypothetical protein